MVNKIVFRVDSSINIGTGHIMRCLTLADGLRQQGLEACFICRELPGNISHLIIQKGFIVYKLPQQEASETSWQVDAEQTTYILQELKEKNKLNWLIVDHYGLDIKWETKIRPYVEKIMIVDDLANRLHDCDLLLDQNLSHDMEIRYDKLVSSACITLFGPKYALLRPEFYEMRRKLKLRTGIIKRILVFFGGTDPSDETQKALQAIARINNIIVDVVVGSSNPNRHAIEMFCSKYTNFCYHCQIDYMAELMAMADVAIGAGGSVTWERCSLGLPTLVVILADNQYELTLATAAQGAIINMGWNTEITEEAYYQAIMALTPVNIQTMQDRALVLADGKGRGRVVKHLLAI